MTDLGRSPTGATGLRPAGAARQLLLAYVWPSAASVLGVITSILMADRLSVWAWVANGLLIAALVAAGPLMARHERLLAVARVAAEQANARDRRLREYFLPHAHGLAPSSLRRGWYFTGRTQVLRELVAWLDTGTDSAGKADWRARVVTGAPGSGKSAVLGRLVSSADRGLRATMPTSELVKAASGTLASVGVVAVAVQAHRLTVDEVAARIAQDLGLDGVATAAALLAALRERQAPTPAGVVVDAVDEAHDPQRLVSALLEPLASGAALSHLKLVIGTRRGPDDRLVEALGAAKVVIDLDDPPHLDPQDVQDYVRQLLLAEGDSELPTPYRGRPELAGEVARRVAARAGSSFLVAQLTARALAAAAPVSDADLDVPDRFPATVGAAMADYLHGVSRDWPWLRNLLAALAWAQGDGLDSPDTWAALAGAVGAGTCTRGLVAQLFDTPAADLLHRSEADGRVHYRLFHEALGEHLRAMTTRGESAEAVEARIARALLDEVPHRADGARDWGAAGPYARTYLSIHAAAGGVLDVLLDDAAFLVAAEPDRLLAALPSAHTTDGRRHAGLIERFGQQLLSCPAGDRASVLELAARTGGNVRMADHLAALDGEHPWSVPWARWHPTEAGRVLCHHDDWVHSLTTVTLRAQPLVMSASSWTVAYHSLMDGQPVPPTFREQMSEIHAAVAVVHDSDLVTVTLHADGELRRIATRGGQHATCTLSRDVAGEDLWLIPFRGSLCAAHFTRAGSLNLTDLDHGKRCHPAVPASVRRILSIVNPRTGLAGAIAIGTDEHGTYLAWDLESGTLIGDPLDPAEAAPGARLRLVGAIPGQSATGDVRVLFGASATGRGLWEELAWSPASNRHTRRDLPWVRSEPSVALALPDGGVCYGDTFGDLHVLAQETSPARRIAAHNSPVQALTVAECNGRTYLVSAGQDGAVRDWPLDVAASNEPLPLTGNMPMAPPADTDGTLVIPYRRDKGTLSIIDVSTGEIVREITPTAGAEIRAATLSPNEAFVVTSDAPTTLACFADDQQRWSVDLATDGARILSVLSISERQSLLVGTADGQLSLLSSATGGLLQRCRPGADRPFWTTAVARGSDVLAASWEPADTAGRIAVTTLSPHGAQSRWLAPPDAPEPSAYFRITDARFIASGACTYLVAVGYRGGLWIWDPDSGQMVTQNQIAATRNRSLNALCQVHTPQGSLLLCGGFQCKLLAWHPDLGEYPEIDLGVPIGDLHDAGNGSVLVASQRGSFLVRIDPDRFAPALDPLVALRHTP